MKAFRYYDDEQRIFAHGYTPFSAAHDRADGPAGYMVWVLKATSFTGCGDPVSFELESCVSDV